MGDSSNMASATVCPICKKAVPKGSTTIPFCSERCRRADLSRWFAEGYSVPIQTERVIEELADGATLSDEPGEN